MANIASTIPQRKDILLSANKSLRKIQQNINPAIIPIQMNQRNLFIGELILNRIINPTMASRRVAVVDTSSVESPN